MHLAQRNERLSRERGFIDENWGGLRKFFADGKEVRPAEIAPRLELIQGDTWQSNLFRLASLTWSVPVSQGYGRRMRFLVWDQSNGKLIGLLGLGDPVFNLRARDDWIGWSLKQRRRRLVNIMDAFVLGALPPYNMLLGGKLLATLVRTTEVRKAFAERYGNSRGVISGKRKHPQLCLVTTTSALGRSSLYNRLALNGKKIFESIGYTSGWGHFHIPEGLFAAIRQYLAAVGDKYADNHKYGQGPNWKLRAIRKALTLVGLSPDLLQHGIGRELLVCHVARNAKRVLTGRVRRASYVGLPSVAVAADWARDRWLLPRSERRPEFRSWDSNDIGNLLVPAAHPATTLHVASVG